MDDDDYLDDSGLIEYLDELNVSSIARSPPLLPPPPLIGPQNIKVADRNTHRHSAAQPPRESSPAVHSTQGTSVQAPLRVLKDKTTAQTRRPEAVLNTKPKLSTRSHVRARSESSASLARLSPCLEENPSHGQRARQRRVPSDDFNIYAQLHGISAQREKLLRRLQILDIQERQLLSSLVPLTTQSQPHLILGTTDENLSINIFPSTVPQCPQAMVNEVPSAPPADLSLPWPVSGPPKTAATAKHSRTSSTSKRAPLSDKTKQSLATFDSTPIYVNEALVLSPPNSPSPSPRSERLLGPSAYEAALASGDVMRVPTTVGVEGGLDETQMGGRSIATRTPGLARYYEIPHTVARKAWDF